MNEIKEIGKTFSLFLMIVAYGWTWIWSLEHIKECNRNAKWEVTISRMFIVFHIGLLVAFFVYCWSN